MQQYRAALHRLLFSQAPRPRDRTAAAVTIAIAVAAGATGIVHLSLGSLLFTLNGVGYLGNAALLLLTLALPRLRYRVRSYVGAWLALYATLTIAGYLIEGAPRSPAAFLALLLEGGIIMGAVVLWGAYRRAYEQRVEAHDEAREHWVSAPSLAPFVTAALFGGLIFFFGANPWSGIRCEPELDGRIDIAACDLLFDRGEITVAAETATPLRFENRVAIPHNVAIHVGSTEAIGEELWCGDLIAGPRTIEYLLPPLAAGRYAFVCSVHPMMVGTLIVARPE